MRVPAKLCSLLPLLLLAPPAAYAQEMFDDAFVSLPLDDEFPDVRPQIPRPATQPTTQPLPEQQREFLLDDPAGLRTWLIDHGITPEASLTLELGKNLAGGRTTRGSAASRLFNFSLALDTEKLASLQGGTAYFLFQQQHGTSPSDEAGDLQGTFATSADGRTQLSEAWYQQALLNQKWLIKAGKIDANGDFAFSDFAANFLNGGMAAPLANPLIPTYPDQALGIDTFLYPCDHFYLGAGIFDGSIARGRRTGENAPSSAFRSPGDYYAIAEAGATWQLTQSNLSGRLKLGAWYQAGSDLESFDGSSHDSTWGPYLVLDQKLLRLNPDAEDDDRGLGLFLILDLADDDLFEVSSHCSAGLTFKGPLASRPADTLACGLSHARLSDHAGFDRDHETAIETFYKLQLTPYLTLQPDLQYILNPAGADDDHALVAALRIELTF